MRLWIYAWSRVPSLRSGFRLRAPASLTPAKRLNMYAPLDLRLLISSSVAQEYSSRPVMRAIRTKS